MDSKKNNSISTHKHPVLKNKSNFLIFADLSDHKLENKWEQLWVKQVDTFKFEICCIPFFVYDLSLGDIVKTKPSKNKTYVIEKVIKPSGHYTFRAWFGESNNPRIIEEVLEFINLNNFRLEWSSQNLLAIDTPSKSEAQVLADFLFEKESLGNLEYETGRT